MPEVKFTYQWSDPLQIQKHPSKDADRVQQWRTAQLPFSLAAATLHKSTGQGLTGAPWSCPVPPFSHLSPSRVTRRDLTLGGSGNTVLFKNMLKLIYPLPPNTLKHTKNCPYDFPGTTDPPIQNPCRRNSHGPFLALTISEGFFNFFKHSSPKSIEFSLFKHTARTIHQHFFFSQHCTRATWIGLHTVLVKISEFQVQCLMSWRWSLKPLF